MDPSSQTHPCTNCGAEVRGTYCSQCGQKQPQPSDFQLKTIFAQAFTEITDFDGKIWRTLYHLFFYPGRLTHAYLQGKRRQYINPFRLYLLAALLYFLVFTYNSKGTIVDLDIAFKMDFYGNTKERVMALWNPEKQSEEEFLEAFIQETRDINNLLLYSSILVYALFLNVWFIRRGIPYAVHLLFGLHFISFGFIREVICSPLLIYFRTPMIILLALHSLWYLYHAVNVCYPHNRWRTFLNALFIYAGFAFIFSNNLFLAIFITISRW
jgi:hypothetical protein